MVYYFGFIKFSFFQKIEILKNFNFPIYFTNWIFLKISFLYLYFSESTIIYWDIAWCTISLFIILLFKYFYINFNILQSQNFSSNIIVDGIY